MNNLIVRSLTDTDTPALSALLTEDSDYSQYFVPFANPSHDFFATLFASVEQDCYWGIFVNKALAGFCMLRGFDAGYQRPSFGVYISKAYQGSGLATLALRWCLSYCRVNQIDAVMLKVHPDNKIARHIYEVNGFVSLGTDERTGHLMMEKRWDAS
ncbi:MAG: GNAT family N-acetyltransferase [Chloroflexota bacterium]